MRRAQYVVLVIGIFISCSKEKPPSAFPYFFVATINNAPVKFEADVTKYGPFECSPLFFAEGYAPNFIHYEGTSFKESIAFPSEQIWVTIVKKFDHLPQPSERKLMWRMGIINYQNGIISAATTTIGGVYIKYTDNNGKGWDSQYGPEDGNTFAVTQIWTDNGYTKFKAKFSCTLYDGLGNSIKLENGKIKGRLF